MSDKPDRPRDVPPPVVRNADGTIVPGTQAPHEPQVVPGSAFGALPDTPFTPDPAIAGPQMPLQPGDGPKQAVDANQPVYAHPQASAAWADAHRMTEKERIEREMAGMDVPSEEENVMPADPPMHDAPASEGEHAQESEEARRQREENERLERERQEEERRNQEHQG